MHNEVNAKTNLNTFQQNLDFILLKELFFMSTMELFNYVSLPAFHFKVFLKWNIKGRC